MTATEQDLLTVSHRVSKAVTAPLYHLDLVGDPLGVGIGDAVLEIAEDRFHPQLKGPPQVDEFGQVSFDDVIDPVALSDAVPDLVASSEGELAPLRIAWSPDAGHYAVETELVDLAASGAQAFAELGSEPVAESPNVGNPWESYMPLYITDARVALGDFLEQHPEDVFPETTDEIASVPPLSAEDYVRAYAKLLKFRSSMAEFFQRFDLLLTPTTAVSAFPCGEPPTVIGGRRVRSGWTSFMPFQIMWNMTGQPAASVPVGFTSEGLPAGMMIVGPVGREDLVLAASAAFERCRPWAQHVPPISAHR